MDFMYTVIISLVFPTLVIILMPQILKHFGYDPSKHFKILIIACLVMLISWYLPSPDIQGADTSFSTHFLGGGVFTGLLWLYIKRVIGWKAKWYIELAVLYALVCSLGVLNELFEVGLFELGVMQSIWDTSWDLIANTLGAATFYVLYWLRSGRKIG